MIEVLPICEPTGIYCVKRTCAILQISKSTLKRLRDKGYITPHNTNQFRYKYSGQSIIDCWKTVSTL